VRQAKSPSGISKYSPEQRIHTLDTAILVDSFTFVPGCIPFLGRTLNIRALQAVLRAEACEVVRARCAQFDRSNLPIIKE